MKTAVRALALVGLTGLLGGCETMTESMKEVASSLPAPAEQMSPNDQVLESNWVQATGYAPISLQPGQTPQHKMIMAMRASKLRAYQELAAIVHGQYLFGTTQVKDMVVQSDQFKTAVAGIVRGARVVKVFPVQDDVYATTLEIDLNQVQRAWVETAPEGATVGVSPSDSSTEFH
ncbi:LPP20 family lipoprotein [Marinobacterium arenosum]|uniref:LPP20 family lipoprotein n=1 Tax=Marinobacterium arenosum TaxID=2862496 RepID=UPI002107DDA8|nr:hypothetical protein [Marinobacterium arenosum]